MSTLKVSELASTSKDVGQWQNPSDTAWHAYRNPDDNEGRIPLLVWLGCAPTADGALSLMHGSSGIIRRGAFLYKVPIGSTFAKHVLAAYQAFKE